MNKYILSTILLASVMFALPIDNEVKDVEPNMEAVNTYLFGEPNPKWLKYVNDDGYYDPSLDPSKDENGEVMLGESYYDAAASVKFWLYTKKQPEQQQILLEDLESIKSSTFDRKHPIRFLVHGWNNDGTSDMIQMIKNAYLEKADFNIIVVDWGKGANSLNYYTSRHRVGNVAEVVTRFIEFLMENLSVKTSQIQVIGHSLGAHVAGITGKSFEKNKIPVIVGLDPASPLFYMNNPESRLDSTDAEYVEVIHTAAGSLGFDKPIGTADFYPNYGRSQPGCGLDLIGTCAHSRAYEYFTESILTDVGFWSNQCGEYTEIKKEKCAPTGIIVTLGGDPLHVTRAIGNYHLVTNKKSPFAMGN